MNDMQLSANFRLSEFACEGELPPREFLPRLFTLTTELEIIRRILGNQPIHINSGWRSARHNAAIGGVEGSHHLTADAADWSHSTLDVMTCNFMLLQKRSLLRFDQLIRYARHHHISTHPRMRMMVLVAPGG